VQVYGGGIWHTWFDRDLGLSGRVMVEGKDGKLEGHLVRFDRPILRIPTLAIHLDRGVNEKFVFNEETHLVPIIETTTKEKGEENKSKNHIHNPNLLKKISEQISVKVESIRDFELCLHDVAPPCIGGLDESKV
jgi:aspartyl aminopeptidase